MKTAPTYDAIPTSRASRVYADATRSAAPSSEVQIIQGRKAVLANSQTLEELCRRSGQADALHWLDYMMTTPTALQKIPTLVLVGPNYRTAPKDATPNNVGAAVLLYEYKIAGRGTGVFATDDTTGQRTVIAPLSNRLQVSEQVCCALLDQGALAVLISSESDAGNCPATHRMCSSGQIVSRTRSVPRYLQLKQTAEATMATLGRHTRRNLRYYRRRLEIELGAEFIPDVEMGQSQFIAINRASTNPVSESLGRWRMKSIQQTPGTLFAGIRAPDGRWLSLIGGRRHNGVTEIDWQINLAGLPRYSLSTVMRAYLLEHEIDLGTTRLAFTGGTPHPIQHSFISVDAVDVIALRRSWRGWMLRKFARWIFPKNNFLGLALRDEQLPWVGYS